MINKKNTLEAESTIKRDEKSFNRLVNIIAYIISIDNKESLGLTRLLKYLYIIDETSVKEIGVPVTDLEYYVAVNGPLANYLRLCFLNGAKSFDKYFKVNVSLWRNLFSTETNEHCKITSLVDKPNLNLLSNYEIELIKETILKYEGVPTQHIIKELHNQGTLWQKIVSKFNIDFETSQSKVSPHKINLEELIKNNEMNSDSYTNYMMFKPC